MMRILATTPVALSFLRFSTWKASLIFQLSAMSHQLDEPKNMSAVWQLSTISAISLLELKANDRRLKL